jgi:hypothetical protein
MRKFYIIFLFFALFQQYVLGQLNFDITKVKGKRHLKTQRHFSKDSTYEPIDITLSKHKFEIRLNAFYAPNGGFATFILYSDGKEWNAIFWEADFLELNDTTRTKYKKVKSMNWDTVVNSLNNLDIFNLPNQRELKKADFVLDGAMYSIAYKVNKRFRQYYFDNPSSYYERYPETLEFKKYKDIVKTFSEAFRE